MRWVRSAAKEYLLRVTDAQRNGRSLGPRSPETERIHHEFQAAKLRADEGEKALRERLPQYPFDDAFAASLPAQLRAVRPTLDPQRT